MNNDNNHDDHDDHDSNDSGPVLVYILDAETQELIETALNCIVSLSDAQIDPNSGEALMAIADALAERFGIPRIDVVETVHTDDNGDEEIIFSPKSGSILPDTDEEEPPTK
jgi:hypothetical protein